MFKNSLGWLTAAIASFAATSAAHCAELPDCKLSNAQDTYAKYKPLMSNTVMRLVDAPTSSQQDGVYAKDQAVLSTDVQIVESSPALVATGDFVLKSSWVMNPDWKFKKGQQIYARRALIGPDGREYAVINPEPGMALFLNPDGEFCNQTLKVRNATPIWLVGHLTRIPDDATVQWVTQGTEIASGKLRIIYTGAAAGVMHFQELWVKGSQVVSTVDRQFDQSATSIQISGLTFRVAEAKSESVKLTYASGTSQLLTRDVLSQIPLAGLR